MIGEHDAAAAYAYGVCPGSHVANEDGSCGAGESLNGVMLGEPETAIAPLLDMFREIYGPRYRGARRFARVHSNEIEN